MIKQMKLFEDEEKQKRIQNQIDRLQYELNYDTRDYPISFIVDLYNNENEIFSPDYQRSELLWSPKQKSRFIESLLLDYPIPLLFLADTDEGSMEIVDGLQRISTLSEFFYGDLKLVGLNKLTELNDCTLDEMPKNEIRRLKARSLRVIVLKHSTPASVRKELFDRLNTSSLRANTSEVRAGRELDNPLMILIKTLAEDELFRENTNLSQNKINRKEDIELVSRFFAFSNNLDNYNGSVMNFVDDYIREAGKNWSDEKKYLFEDEFNKTMRFVSDNFERGFQKEDRNHTPRVRFEALSVGINLALRESPQLNVSIAQIDKLLNSEHLKKWTTSDAANNRTKVISRIHGVRDFLLNGDFND
jgi:hypothetical protein